MLVFVLLFGFNERFFGDLVGMSIFFLLNEGCYLCIAEIYMKNIFDTFENSTGFCS